jgi:hypothetical protein
MSNLLYNAPLYYPSAREWMWNYCIYLGPFTDRKGHNYDLGIHIDYGSVFEYSNATVYGNERGDYQSGDLFRNPTETATEVVRRAKELKLIP